jgi:hypothetical protein
LAPVNGVVYPHRVAGTACENGRDERTAKLDAICFWLIQQCIETEAETMTINQKNVKREGQELGDWEIIVRKKSK